jgi:hypothetical protein
MRVMNDPYAWSNRETSDGPALTYDDLLKAVEQSKKTPVPGRLEAGTRMYWFFKDKLAAAEQPSTHFTCGLPVILREDLPSELAHLYDTNDWLMKTFMWKEGDEGPKIIVFTHPSSNEKIMHPKWDEYWRRNDVQRAPEGPVQQKPRVRDRMARNAPGPPDHPNDGHSPLQVWLDARGLGSPDGGEPGEDQTG